MAQFLSTAAHNLQTLGKHPVQENTLSAASSDERKKKEKKRPKKKLVHVHSFVKKIKKEGEGHLSTAFFSSCCQTSLENLTVAFLPHPSLTPNCVWLSLRCAENFG